MASDSVLIELCRHGRDFSIKIGLLFPEGLNYMICDKSYLWGYRTLCVYISQWSDHSYMFPFDCMALHRFASSDRKVIY